MAEDPTSIWEHRHPDRIRRKPRSKPEAAAAAPDPPPSPGGIAASAVPAGEMRLTLQEASKRYGVPPSTLGSWCRSGAVDGVKREGRWMVTPGSVSARKRGGRDVSPGPQGGPSVEGTAMLVPRDAWDKLMDQLGNLHQAGQQLAEARERAARAETEAVFLRERLGEVREDRDALRRRLGEEPPPPRSVIPRRTRLARIFRRD